MKNRKIKSCIPIAGLLMTALYADVVVAGWYGDQSQQYRGQGYGDFPPRDIDEILQKKSMDVHLQQEDKKPGAGTETAAGNSSQPQPVTPQAVTPQAPAARAPTAQAPVAQVPTAQYAPQYAPQNYRGYDRWRNPWNNRAGFTGPWNNRSGFSGPWNNRGSGFSGPWNNNGSSFTGPWNNNGSSFTMPWGNNGSGFSPWGNRGGWR